MSVRPRNSKLSAYYGLPQSERSHAKTSPASEAGLPSEENLHENAGITSPITSAVRYAEKLIGTKPLPELLECAIKLRHERNDARTEWHASLVRCYNQLEKAANIAAASCHRAAQLQADENGMLRAARENAHIASRISAAMEPSRKQVSALEGPRQLDLLLRAAGILTVDLPSHYQGLVDLCLDQEAARRALFVSCRRYAALLPVFDRLVSINEAIFKSPHEKLVAASLAIRTDLDERLSRGDGSIEGMELYDVVQIRFLLGDQLETLRHVFLQAADLHISSKSPSPESVEAASGLPITLASFHVSYATEIFLPELRHVCTTFSKIFLTNDDERTALKASREGAVEFAEDGVSSFSAKVKIEDEFTLWLLQIMDSRFGSPVRAALSKIYFQRSIKNTVTSDGEDDTVAESISLNAMLQDDDRAYMAETDLEVTNIGQSSDARKFRLCMDALRNVVRANAPFPRGSLLAKLEATVTSICEDLEKHAVSVILHGARHVLNESADAILDRNYVTQGRIDVDALKFSRLLSDVQEQSDTVLTSLGFERVLLVDEVFQFITRNALERASAHFACNREWNIRCLLSAAVLSDALGRMTWRTDVMGVADMRLARSQLIHAYELATSRQVVGILASCLNSYIVSDDNVTIGTLSAEINDAVSILERTQREISATLTGVQEMQEIMGTQDDALDDGGIVQRIARGWVYIVREETIFCEKLVHQLQVDSTVLARAVAFPGVFDVVPQAAVLRCTELVSFLAPSEISRLLS